MQTNEDPVPGMATSLHVRRAVDGDDDSIAWLVDRLRPLLLAQAAWRLGPGLRRVCEPEDLVHEAWLVLLPRLGSLPPRDGRLTPVLLSFLSTTILHKANNLLRREARRKLAGHEVADSHGDDDSPIELGGPRSEVIASVVRREMSCQVQDALAELPDQDREIILLRGIEQQDPEIVAQLYDISRGALSKRYNRALARLRQRLPDSVLAELLDD